MKDPRKHMTHNILSLLMLRVIQAYLIVNFFVISFRIYFISFDNFSENDLENYVKPVFLIYKLLQLLAQNILRLMMDLLLFQFLALILLINQQHGKDIGELYYQNQF